MPLPAEVAQIAAQVGEVFGLDLYGVDVLLGPDGPVVVDINDFPSFRQVPDAVARVARAVLRLARTGTAVTAPAVALDASGLETVGLGAGAVRMPAQGGGAAVGAGVASGLGGGLGGGGVAVGGVGGVGIGGIGAAPVGGAI